MKPGSTSGSMNEMDAKGLYSAGFPFIFVELQLYTDRYLMYFDSRDTSFLQVTADAVSTYDIWHMRCTGIILKCLGCIQLG